MDKVIEFTETVTHKREGKPDQVFEAGKRYALRIDRARHWLNRDVAVEVKGGAAVPRPAKIIPPEQRPSPFPPVNFQASKESVEFAQGGADGNAVESSADVPGKDGSDPGERGQLIPRRGRGRPSGGRSGAGNK